MPGHRQVVLVHPLRAAVEALRLLLRQVDTVCDLGGVHVKAEVSADIPVSDTELS